MDQVEPRRHSLMQEYGLGAPLVSTSVSGCELSIHRVAHTTPRTFLKRGIGLGKPWTVTIAAVGDDSAHPFSVPRDRGYVLHSFGGRYEPGTVVYGMLKDHERTVEVTVGTDQQLPVQVETGAFLAVLPEAPEIVLTWRDTQGIPTRRRRLSTMGSPTKVDIVEQLLRRLGEAWVEYERRLSEYERSLGSGKYRDQNSYGLMSERLREETGVAELRSLLNEWGVKWAEKPFARFRR